MFVDKKKESTVLNIRMSSKQKKVLEAMASERSLSMSELVKSLLEIEMKFNILKEYKSKI